MVDSLQPCPCFTPSPLYCCRADPLRRTVRQHRMTFLYEQTHYEIYVYKKPCRGLSLLLVQVFADDANPVMPPFLELGQEVTAQEFF